MPRRPRQCTAPHPPGRPRPARRARRAVSRPALDAAGTPFSPARHTPRACPPLGGVGSAAKCGSVRGEGLDPGRRAASRVSATSRRRSRRWAGRGSRRVLRRDAARRAEPQVWAGPGHRGEVRPAAARLGREELHRRQTGLRQGEHLRERPGTGEAAGRSRRPPRAAAAAGVTTNCAPASRTWRPAPGQDRAGADDHALHLRGHGLDRRQPGGGAQRDLDDRYAAAQAVPAARPARPARRPRREVTGETSRTSAPPRIWRALG